MKLTEAQTVRICYTTFNRNISASIVSEPQLFCVLRFNVCFSSGKKYSKTSSGKVNGTVVEIINLTPDMLQ